VSVRPHAPTVLDSALGELTRRCCTALAESIASFKAPTRTLWCQSVVASWPRDTRASSRRSRKCILEGRRRRRSSIFASHYSRWASTATNACLLSEKYGCIVRIQSEWSSCADLSQYYREQELYLYMKEQLQRFAETHNERLLQTTNNPISFGTSHRESSRAA